MSEPEPPSVLVGEPLTLRELFEIIRAGQEAREGEKVEASYQKYLELTEPEK